MKRFHSRRRVHGGDEVAVVEARDKEEHRFKEWDWNLVDTDDACYCIKVFGVMEFCFSRVALDASVYLSLAP